MQCSGRRVAARLERARAGSMVWGRMGLLDEAIREHLELKRRSGADPSEVARKESEALAPAPGSEPAGAQPAGDPGGAQPAGTAPGAGLAPTGQETQELDMQSVIDAQEEFEWELPPARAASGAEGEHSLEHASEPEQAQAPIPGQERMPIE